MGILSSLNQKKTGKGQQLAAFTKTSSSLLDKLKKWSLTAKVDDKFFEDLLVVLLEADVGFATADKIISRLKKSANQYINVSFAFVLDLLSKEILTVYQEREAEAFRSNPHGPDIIIMVGVNGTGKTTTVAKLASYLKQDDKKILTVACDTFRAGATQQLLTWAKRAGVDCVTGAEGADPASVVVDACRKGMAENYDCILCDTAGRLQNKVNLMNELAKIKRVAEKELGSGVVNAYLVVDATTGQNGINQAQVFLDNCDVNGIILTKLDGTAKGGIVLAIKDQLNIEVKYIGTGEQLEDLAPFVIEDFVVALTQGENHA